MRETDRKTVEITAPLLHLAGSVTVIVCVPTVLSFIENSVGLADYEGDGGLNALTTLYFNGDVPAAISLLLFGGILFGALGRLFSWSEGPRRSTLAGHVRRCSLSYALIALSGLVVVAEYAANYGADASGVTGGYVVAVAVFLTAGYAILLDALMTFRRARYVGVGTGAST